MQKKLIALAVAGLVSGAAFAQSNVTVYGVADAYVGHITADGGKSVNAVNSGGLSGSRLGFRGAEDLGNGLKAVFEYELAFNLDNTGAGNMGVNNTGAGNGINGTRQSMVGLAGGFGTAVLGRLQSPGYYVGKFDALASAAISPQAILASNTGLIGGLVNSTIAPNNNARVNNAAAYITPSFSGFSAVIAHSFGEQATDPKESVTALGLNYEAGPLAVGFVHHSITNYAPGLLAALGLPTDVGDAKENMIGASYDLKMVKILGSYQDAKLKDTDKNKLWQIGVVAPVGPGNVHFAYGKLNMAADNMDAKSWTIAYTYGLSKRTTAYAGYNKTDNDGSAAAGQIAGLTAPTPGGSAKGMVLGLRHTF